MAKSKNNSNRKYIFRLPPCPDYDVEGTESWLAEMAGKGLHLRTISFGVAAFAPGEPKSVRYRLMPAENGTSLFSENGGEPDREAVVLGEKYGWRYVTKRGNFFIFRTESPGARELHTDPGVLALQIRAVQRRQFSAAVPILFGAAVALWGALRSGILLTVLAIGTGLFLLSVVLLVSTLALTVHELLFLGRLKKRLRLGESLSHTGGRRHPALHRAGTVSLAVLFAVWLVALSRGWMLSAADEDKTPLAAYTGTVPFATMRDFAGPDTGPSEETMKGIAFNHVREWSDPLAPVNIDWTEHRRFPLADGTALDGGYTVFYHEAANEWIAEELAAEYLRHDRQEKNFEPAELTLSAKIDFCAAYYNEVHFPTVILRRGNTVLRASFYTVGESGRSFTEWVERLAESIA